MKARFLFYLHGNVLEISTHKHSFPSELCPNIPYTIPESYPTISRPIKPVPEYNNSGLQANIQQYPQGYKFKQIGHYREQSESIYMAKAPHHVNERI